MEIQNQNRFEISEDVLGDCNVPKRVVVVWGDAITPINPRELSNPISCWQFLARCDQRGEPYLPLNETIYVFLTERTLLKSFVAEGRGVR